MTRLAPVAWAAATGVSGTCYKALLWLADALDAAALDTWKRERAALTARMRDAGIKGSRGLLGQLENELAALNRRIIEEPLAACAQSALAPAHARALGAQLRSEPTVRAYRIGAAYAEALVELTGEDSSLPELLQRWQAATPGLAWCADLLIQALQPAEAAAWQQACGSCETSAQAEEEDALAAMKGFRHVTVLLDETVAALQPAEGKVYIDATLGGGGHTERLLQAGAEVWGLDQDPAARAAARKRLAAYGDRLHIVAGNFRNIADIMREHEVGPADGLLADIGISSPQVDCAQRGFSFLNDGPLDMRMDPGAPRSAADIVNTAAESELADILWQYGEERASRAIARRIVQERSKAPISTTGRLADIISGVLPRKGKQHPATRSFQALRIVVNDELGALANLLQNGLGLLKSGGRFAVITFHSLEDRAVKQGFDLVTRPEIDRPEWPAPRPNPAYAARLVCRKPITPGEAELAANPRSRSAKLRVIEKL